jgi:hypothetical protein
MWRLPAVTGINGRENWRYQTEMDRLILQIDSHGVIGRKFLGSDSILSQDAIDALLNGVSEVSSSAPVADSPEVTQAEEIITSASVDVPDQAALPTVDKSDDEAITRDQIIEIAGEAAEAESLPIQNSMARMSKRVDALEMALERITDLEQQVAWLRKTI